MADRLPNEGLPRVRLTGCLVLTLMLLTLCVLPLLFFEVATQALENLNLSPLAASFVLLGMLLGSFVNLPVARFPTDREVVVRTFEPIGGWFFPRYERLRHEIVVAVNVGGCVIPVLLAVWQLLFIVGGGTEPLAVMLIGMSVNTAVCYWTARPLPNLGIALPLYLPALVALSTAWIGLWGQAFDPYRASVAFVIGITGPLVGADLLHWKDFKEVGMGTVSIGGAGTWDGIVLSGLMAALFGKPL